MTYIGPAITNCSFISFSIFFLCVESKKGKKFSLSCFHAMKFERAEPRVLKNFPWWENLWTIIFLDFSVAFQIQSLVRIIITKLQQRPCSAFKHFKETLNKSMHLWNHCSQLVALCDFWYQHFKRQRIKETSDWCLHCSAPLSSDTCSRSSKSLYECVFFFFPIKRIIDTKCMSFSIKAV